MSGLVTLYSGAIGMNNKVPAHRLEFNANESLGVSALEAAKNVIIDMSGEVTAYRGSKKILSGDFHSPFKCQGGFYVAENRGSDTAIRKASIGVSGLLTLESVLQDMERGNRICYTFLDGRLLFSNGATNGHLSETTGHGWPVNLKDEDDTREMVTCPAFTHMDVLSGVIVGSVGKEVIFTEYGLPGLTYGVGGRRRFESDIIMIKAVDAGVFISTMEEIFFLAGRDPRLWELRRVFNYPAIQWCEQEEAVSAKDYGIDMIGRSVVMGTVRGVVIGLPDGTAYNLIDKVINMPGDCGSSCGGLMTHNTTIIQSVEHGGAIAVQGAIGEIGSKATTELSLPFNSMITAGGFQYGFNSEGVFALNTDNGAFERSFTLATTDLGIDNFKRGRCLFVGFEVDSLTPITIKISFGGAEKEVIITPKVVGLQREQVDIPHTIQGRYLTLEVSSMGWFRMDKIEGEFYTLSSGVGSML